MPLSFTEISIKSPVSGLAAPGFSGAAALVRFALISTLPPSGVNFTAFVKRLNIICLSFLGSAAILISASAATSKDKLILCLCAFSCSRVSEGSKTSFFNDSVSGSSSIFPASTLERSNISLIRLKRCLPLVLMLSTYFFCFSFNGPKYWSCITSAKPIMAFRGVLNSWDILARKSDFARLAASAWTLACSSSRFCSKNRLIMRMISPNSVLSFSSRLAPSVLSFFRAPDINCKGTLTQRVNKTIKMNKNAPRNAVITKKNFLEPRLKSLISPDSFQTITSNAGFLSGPIRRRLKVIMPFCGLEATGSSL